jgi:hypothetical protein
VGKCGFFEYLLRIQELTILISIASGVWVRSWKDCGGRIVIVVKWGF